MGNEERVSLPRCTLLSFQRPLCGGTLIATSLLELGTRKSPSIEGPAYRWAGVPADWGLLLRGCSFRDPKQERPRSIGKARHEVQLLRRA